MGRVLNAAFLCLLAWFMLASAPPAAAVAKTCSYTILVGGINQNVPTALLGLTTGALPVGAAQFTSKGRYKFECGWGVQCWFADDDEYKTAQTKASQGAEKCVKDAINQFGMPPSCTQRQFYIDSPSGHKTWSEVDDWRFPNLKQSAIDSVCARATARVQSIYILVRRRDGYSSRCDIEDIQTYHLWTGSDGYCFSDRPLQPLPNLPPNPGERAGRPVPADPTGGIPPPPGYGLTAAPDLRVEKTVDKTCLPNRHCKFKVKVSNVGLGVFKGPLTLTDTITPASERLAESGPAPWSCAGANGSYTCKHPGIELHPGQSTEISLAFLNTSKGRGTVENCARMDWETPPLGGICSAAIAEALARERGAADSKTASDTDKAVKAFQCKSGVPETGKPDAALLRMAIKSIGVGDTNRNNDLSCAVSSIDIPVPETTTLTPEQTECTGGRFRSRSTGECLCPSTAPSWDGRYCQRGSIRTTSPPPRPATPGRPPLTPDCSGGQYWDVASKQCLCPSNRPAWNGKVCSARRVPPPQVPPQCTGGQFFDASTRRCRCPSGKPIWDGKYCRAYSPGVSPGLTNPSCAGGMYWDKKAKACRCPKSAPFWSAKSKRCVTKLITTPPKPRPPTPGTSTPPQTYTPPTTTAPSASKPVCRGGKMVGALCWCGIGKFPKKVGNNVYQCQ